MRPLEGVKYEEKAAAYDIFRTACPQDTNFNKNLELPGLLSDVYSGSDFRYSDLLLADARNPLRMV
jgi:hypothetical protein